MNFYSLKKKKNADEKEHSKPQLSGWKILYLPVWFFENKMIKQLFLNHLWCMLFTVEDIYVTPSNNTSWKKLLAWLFTCSRVNRQLKYTCDLTK